MFTNHWETNRDEKLILIKSFRGIQARGLPFRLGPTGCTETPCFEATCGPCIGNYKNRADALRRAVDPACPAPYVRVIPTDRLHIEKKKLRRAFGKNLTNRSSTVKEAHHHQLQQQSQRRVRQERRQRRGDTTTTTKPHVLHTMTTTEAIALN